MLLQEQRFAIKNDYSNLLEWERVKIGTGNVPRHL